MDQASGACEAAGICHRELRRKRSVMAQLLHPPSGVSDRISVIVPFYGTFSMDRIGLCIESLLYQKGVDLEVVISEQGASPSLELAQDERLRHVFSLHISSPDVS